MREERRRKLDEKIRKKRQEREEAAASEAKQAAARAAKARADAQGIIEMFDFFFCCDQNKPVLTILLC
jgi:hypothetical protein